VQISAGTPLAHRYNDVAPLESHHCSYAFRLLDDPTTNPFHNLTVEQFRHLREDMIRCISATDMGRHNDIMRNFRAIVDVFDIHEAEHKVARLPCLSVPGPKCRMQMFCHNALYSHSHLSHESPRVWKLTKLRS